MNLGLIRMPDPMGDPRALDVRLELASRLGFQMVYLPATKPRHVIGPGRDSSVQIGLDASAFGPRSPSNLETDIRDLNDALEGRLNLGIRMCCGDVSTQSRAEAQNFETMFSRDSTLGRASVPSRFPLRSPCPKIMGIPVTGSAQEAKIAAARGYYPLTPSWLSHQDVARHWPAIVKGATSALRRARPSHWQVARSIVVHDDPATVQAYVFGAKSPFRAYYTRLMRQGLILSDSIETTLKNVVISGSIAQVSEKLLAFREAVGDFGTLHLIDFADCDPEMTLTTMTRLAEDIMPLVGKTNVDTHNELERT